MLAASGLQCIPGCAISVKLHPQEVLAAKLGTEYACSKRSEIDSKANPHLRVMGVASRQGLGTVKTVMVISFEHIDRSKYTKRTFCYPPPSPLPCTYSLSLNLVVFPVTE